MTKPPTTSVVIGTYNRGARIARTLDSVLAQTVPADEIVVVDDGSTDDTADWIRARYPLVSVMTFPNGGTSLARNRGAVSATGDLLVFIDHDDAMHPHAIETLRDLLIRFPEAQAAYADHRLVDLTTGEIFENHHDAIPAFHRMRAIATLRTDGSDRLYGENMYMALLHGNLLQQPWMVRRSALEAVGGFDPDVRYCEDWDLYIRITQRFPVALTDRVIADHYVEGQNLHRAAGQETQHMKVLRKHIRMAGATQLRSQCVLRRRLALYYKAEGDRRRSAGDGGALRSYLASFACWPFDAVVAARCAAWSAAYCLNVTRGSGAIERR